MNLAVWLGVVRSPSSRIEVREYEFFWLRIPFVSPRLNLNETSPSFLLSTSPQDPHPIWLPRSEASLPSVRLSPHRNSSSQGSQMIILLIWSITSPSSICLVSPILSHPKSSSASSGRSFHPSLAAAACRNGAPIHSFARLQCILPHNSHLLLICKLITAS